LVQDIMSKHEELSRQKRKGGGSGAQNSAFSQENTGISLQLPKYWKRGAVLLEPESGGRTGSKPIGDSVGGKRRVSRKKCRVRSKMFTGAGRGLPHFSF